MSPAPIYALPPPDVLGALETTADGLSPAAAQARQALYGLNVLREPPAAPVWRKLAAHMTHFMALLLWAAGGLAFAGGRPVLGLVMWGVVLVNALFSFWQAYRAERAIEALRQLLPDYARVRRAGEEARQPVSEIVPGDVLVLAEGDHIPADARVIEAFGLRVNQATLTGEPVPAHKTADASIRPGPPEIERPNLVFAGTSVVSGTGRAVVYATGMLTQFGRIANLTQSVVEVPSALPETMARVSRYAALIALGLGGLVFLNAVLEVGVKSFEAFLLAVGIIVAVIPEGLQPTVTLALAMAAQRLAQRGVLVKKLAVLETLGNTSVLCTDKSGTLTQNQMTVRDVWVAGRRYAITGVGYAPNGQFEPAPPAGALWADVEQLLAAALLCNNARLTPPSAEQPVWSCLGDQTEAALRVLALKGGVNEPVLDQALPRIHELPFDARRKRMSTIHRAPSANGRASAELAFVKGAPKEVLQLCTHILVRGQARPLDAPMRAQIMAANDDYARQALRVLALARRELPARTGTYTPERVERDLTFLGLVAMMDPPRPEVAAAVRTCRQAGIRLVMITGDYGLTAESLARRVGLLATDTPRILTGAELDALDDADVQALLGDEVIFARMAPVHKLRLVAAFQARGDVVAVTGDGVNDVPALRKADVGVAMGVTGTAVAKEAADLVLTNDNFAAIASAIEEGRAVYDNLRKFMTYIFASNVPEVMSFILASLLGLPLALTVTHILAIDLGTDLLPALALGTEKPEPNVMQRPPRRRGTPLLDRGLLVRAFLWLGLIETALAYTGFLTIYLLAGYTDLLHLPRQDLLPYAERLLTPEGRVYVLATTMFHAGVVMAQVGNAFASRTERERLGRLGWLSNRFLLAGVAVEIGLILLLIYVRPLAALFEHLPLPPAYWIGLSLFAPLLYALDRVRKSIVRRLEPANVGAQRRIPTMK